MSAVQEVKLAETRAERNLQDSLAEIFSIIVTIDELEKAFLKDAIPEVDYTEICERSLKQYKSLVADETVSRAFVGLEEFKAEWDVRNMRAYSPDVDTADIGIISSRFLAQRKGYELECPKLQSLHPLAPRLHQRLAAMQAAR